VADTMETTGKSAERRRAAIERSSGMFAHLSLGASLVDELIADRRREARAEEQVGEATSRFNGKR
jgi:hypothetical protein